MLTDNPKLHQQTVRDTSATVYRTDIATLSEAETGST